MAVILETSLGDVTIDLMTDERPRCCLNFLKLCKMKYYNFALFHSVQRNLVAQAGDPTYTGKGGESIFYHLYGEQAKYFEAETKPRIKHRDRGVVSMVNNGKNQHGSQFFITLAKNLDYLDGVHTVFGEVTEGFEILDKINEAHTDNTHRPYVDIRIYHTAIIDDPFDDPKGLRIPSQSPEPTKEQLVSVRIAPDEEIDDTKGKSKDEVEEMEREKEAKKDAMLLEMVGDLPDQEVKPPDNVLFVCKLNPVTTEEDLEIIFSRFGKIESCEVIKDQKSGESLQYAFVEFESPDSCEKAYFKMDNVLIDDRRIHVDFSQSVSKMKWRGKGKGVEYVKPDRRDNPDNRTRNDNRGRGKSPPKPRSPVKNRSPVRNKSPKSRRDDTHPRQKRSKKASPSRSRTPERKKKLSRSRSRTPERKKKAGRSRSRTPERKRKPSRSQSRTPERKRKPSRSRSKTPKRKKKASRSRSRTPKRRKNDRSRSKTPDRKKNDRRSRSMTPERKKKDRRSRHRSSSEETPVKKRRSGSTDRHKSKKKKKDISRSRSRSKERSSTKRRDKSSSESPPRKKKSSKSTRRSPSPKKSKSRHRSPSASPPRRRKRDSSSDSSDDDRRRRKSKKSR